MICALIIPEYTVYRFQHPVNELYNNTKNRQRKVIKFVYLSQLFIKTVCNWLKNLKGEKRKEKSERIFEFITFAP